MAFAKTIGSLMHSDQLRSLREQAGALMSTAGDRVDQEAENRPAPVQGLLAYLPTVMEYAGLFAAYLRPRTESPVDAPVMRDRGRVSYWRAARPYVLATVAFGAFGYAAWRLVQHQAAQRR